MKKILFILFFLISLSGFGQDANYYVSQSDGDDGDSGLTPALAWKTINKLDATTFQADDSIFFNRGDTWREQFAPLGDGTLGHNVVITAYGTGSKPLITARDSISGWSRDANWTNTSGNIWRMAAVRFGSLDHIRLFVDGIEMNRAQTASVTSTYRWFFDSPTADPADDRLYLYSVGNPGATYTDISTSFGRASCIILSSDNYFTISYLELQDGQSSIDITNCAGTVIDSCRVSGWYGIWVSGGTGTWSNGGEIKNCIINSENTSTGYTWNPTYTYDAIKINGNVKNWNIHNNYVKDYGHSSINLINTVAGRRIDTIKVYNNLFRSPNQDFGGRIEVDYLAGSGNEFYKNKIYNISVSNQINGENLKFYYNIIDTVKASVYSPTNAIGIIISGYELTSTPHNMEFYNNVIANCVDEGVYISHALGTRPAKYNINFTNNILYNNGGSIMVFVDAVLPADSVRNNTFKNNIIYDNGGGTPITYRGTAMSVTTFNSQNGTEGDVILSNLGDNPLFTSASDFNLLSGSPAINSGIDAGLTSDIVDTSVPQGFYFDIGAYEFTSFPISTTGLGWENIYSKRNFKDDVNIAAGFSVDGVPIVFSGGAPVNIPGLTASASELNILDGATVTTAEINHSDGVTSAIQTQIDGKLDTTKFHSGGTGGSVTLSGGDAITLTTTGATGVTLPTSGTLATTTTTHAVSDSSNMAYWFIAASNASAREKLIADAVCDGTADQVEIIAALTAGYNVKLSSGTFTVAASITTPADNRIIEGQGLNTIITAVNALNTRIIYLSKNGWTIRNLKLDGNSAGQSSTNANLIFSNGVVTDTHIENVYFYDAYWDGINMRNGDDRTWITNCTFDDLRGDGIYFGNTGTSSNVHIEGCQFNSIDGVASSCGILISGNEPTSRIENITISNCSFVNNGYLDIYLFNNTVTDYTISNVTISNCVSFNSGGFRTEGARHVTMSNNVLRNVDHDGILVQGLSDMINITGNVIDSLKYNGIDVLGLALKHPTNITIIGNTIRGALAVGEAGINLEDTVSYVTIQSNNIDSCTYGIFINNAINYTNVSGNMITSCPIGLHMTTNVLYTMVQNNLFQLSSTRALNIGDATVDYTRVIGNDFDNNTDDIANGGDGTIFGENIWDDGTYGKPNISYVATADGTGTGIINPSSQFITVTSTDANYIVCLPSASANTIGTRIEGVIGDTGFELRVASAQAETVYLNGVTTNVEAAIPANHSFEAIQIDATHWILKAWDAEGSIIAGIVPDEI